MIVNWKCKVDNKEVIMEKVKLLKVLKRNSNSDNSLCLIRTIDSIQHEYEIYVDNSELKDVT